MLIRVFEYDSLIAVESAVIENNHLEAIYPNSAVIYLRSKAEMPVNMNIEIMTTGGIVDYAVEVMKVKDYDIDAIFEKKLFMLIPFYIFNLENRLSEFEAEPAKLTRIYGEIAKRIEILRKHGKIDSYEHKVLTDAVIDVTNGIARNHGKVRKEMKAVMRGPLLRYDWEDDYEEALDKGMNKELAMMYAEIASTEKRKILLGLVKDGLITVSAAAERLKLTEEGVNDLIEFYY